MKVASLFAGIGGFDLGLRNAGFDISWQVEIDPFCQKVLEKHFPKTMRFSDVCSIDGNWLSADVLCGGFPCQDLSNAPGGSRKGLEGEKSGLWFEMLRLIRQVRPRWVLIENVPRLLTLGTRGIGVVLRGLAELGFDAEWTTVSARECGEMHLRRRLFIVAYSHRFGWRGGASHVDFNAVGDRYRRITAKVRRSGIRDGWDVQRWIGKTYDARGFPATDPRTLRRVDGIPDRLDRVKACGNAILPCIAEAIGERIRELDPF